jgi:hypothetical protein
MCGLRRRLSTESSAKYFEVPEQKKYRLRNASARKIIEAPRLVVNDNVTFLGMAKVGTGKSLPA